MSFVLPLLAVLVPILITPGILFHYDSAPPVIILMLAMAALLIRPRFVADAMDRLRQRPAGRFLTMVAAAQTIWFATTSALSSHPLFSLYGSNWRRLGLVTTVALMIFVVLAASNLADKPQRIQLLLRVMSLVTIAASIYGIAQYFDLDPLQTFTGYQAKDGDSVIVRPPGTFGHADYFGWWLAISFFCALAVANMERGLWRIAGIGAVFLSGSAILLSGTRAAILATFGGFVCLTFVSGQRPRRSQVIGALLFIAIFGIFVGSPAGERVRARVRWSGDEPFGGGRPLLWRDSLRMSRSRLATGFGPETFSAEFPSYQSPELARLLPDFYHESPHNAALDVLVSEGVPGLAILLAWAGLAVYAARLCPKAHKDLGAYLVSAMAASAIASLFNSITVAPLFATLLVIAMVVALSGEVAAEPKRIRAAFFLSPALSVGLAAFGLLLGAYEFRLAQFAKASAQKEPAPAIEAYNALIRASHAGGGEDAYCSRRILALCANTNGLLPRIECLRVATQAAVRATRTADNPPNAWYNLAIFTAAQNDRANTEMALRTSTRLAPNWFKPHLALANLLFVTGRSSEAAGEAARAELLSAGKDPEVTAALHTITHGR